MIVKAALKMDDSTAHATETMPEMTANAVVNVPLMIVHATFRTATIAGPKRFQAATIPAMIVVTIATNAASAPRKMPLMKFQAVVTGTWIIGHTEFQNATNFWTCAVTQAQNTPKAAVTIARPAEIGAQMVASKALMNVNGCGDRSLDGGPRGDDEGPRCLESGLDRRPGCLQEWDRCSHHPVYHSSDGGT